MSESSLEKIFRLTGVPVGDSLKLAARPGSDRVTSSYIRKSRRGKPVAVHSYPTPDRVAGGKIQLAAAYRASWSNVHVGDLLEFGSELWKVIPASSFPGNKPTRGVSTGSPGQTSHGTGKATGGSTVGVRAYYPGGTGTKKKAGSSQGAAAPGGQGAAGTPQAHTNYLQDVKNPENYDALTLPLSYVVTVVPVTPALRG